MNDQEIKLTHESENFAEANVAETMRVIAIALHQALPDLKTADPVFEDLQQDCWLFATALATRVKWNTQEAFYGSLNHWVRIKAWRWFNAELRVIRTEKKIQYVSISSLSFDDDADDDETNRNGSSSHLLDLSVDPKEFKDAESPSEILEKLFHLAEVPLHERVAFLHDLSLPGRKNSHAVSNGTWKGDWFECDGFAAWQGTVSVKIGPGSKGVGGRCDAVAKILGDGNADKWDPEYSEDNERVDRKQIVRWRQYAERKLSAIV